MKITTKHVRNSLVTFVTHERSAVLLRKLTIVEGVINVVWVYFCLDHLLGYFATARREKPANPEFFVYEQ